MIALIQPQLLLNGIKSEYESIQSAVHKEALTPAIVCIKKIRKEHPNIDFISEKHKLLLSGSVCFHESHSSDNYA